MAVGPGKYDDLCTYVREQARGDGAVVILMGGSKGSGFSVQGDLRFQMSLPAVLRMMADQIEADLPQIKTLGPRL